VLLAALAWSTIAAARPSEADTCASASEAGQRLEMASRLIEARQNYLTCSRPACPSVVAQYCAGSLSKVESELPTIVLHVVDARGADVRDGAILTIDGVAQPSALGGVAVIVDPGSHTARVQRGSDVVEQTFVAHEGEKDRAVNLAFRVPAPVPPPHQSLAEPPPRPHAPWTAYALAGVAVAALGTFAVTAIDGQARYDSQSAACKRDGCSSDAWASMRIERIVSWAALGTGAVAGAASVWLFVHPTRETRVGISALTGGAGIHVQATFQ
jgi:hypothetical protein